MAFNFGSAPNSNPFGRKASPIPSPSQTGTITVTWTFTCGHSFKQEKSTVFTSLFTPLPFQTKSSTQQCPECTEATEDKRKAEREAARAKGETARKVGREALQKQEAARLKDEEKRQQEAKALEHEKQALDVYKAQATSIQKHIDGAGDNVELRSELATMLKNCKLLWANKLRKAVAEEREAAPAGAMSKAALEDKLEKANLMAERAEILRNQERRKAIPIIDNAHMEKMKKLEAQVEAWQIISAKMKESLETYEAKISPHLEAVGKFETETRQAWENALKLMKAAE